MNTNQIAAEAAQEIKRFISENEYANEVDFESIIQAAIEKATEDLRNTNVNLLRSLNAAQGEIIEMKAARELASRAAHASENLVTLTDQYRKGYKAGKKAAHASEQGEAVPSNWCDDLLTGPDGIGKPPYNCIHIEKLLNGIRKRILQT